MKTSAMMRCPKCEETSELDNLHLLDRSFKREWVGLAKEDRLCAKYMQDAPEGIEAVIDYIESKLKEKNGA
jgi:hypothetical protein